MGTSPNDEQHHQHRRARCAMERGTGPKRHFRAGRLLSQKQVRQTRANHCRESHVRAAQGYARSRSTQGFRRRYLDSGGPAYPRTVEHVSLPEALPSFAYTGPAPPPPAVVLQSSGASSESSWSSSSASSGASSSSASSAVPSSAGSSSASSGSSSASSGSSSASSGS